ncbi:nematocyst expressed protein 4-like [Penaeus chinensis]|uniref:nematocyst expressed protein 4-like n=1 Tax=Penaeus chinensis TaxID=139456 RepID=UPI001FB5D0BC|nr:nematocyst expressed protein 4-like [Penaeus chinensis]
MIDRGIVKDTLCKNHYRVCQPVICDHVRPTPWRFSPLPYAPYPGPPPCAQCPYPRPLSSDPTHCPYPGPLPRTPTHYPHPPPIPRALPNYPYLGPLPHYPYRVPLPTTLPSYPTQLPPSPYSIPQWSPYLTATGAPGGK